MTAVNPTAYLCLMLCCGDAEHFSGVGGEVLRQFQCALLYPSALESTSFNTRIKTFSTIYSFNQSKYQGDIFSKEIHTSEFVYEDVMGDSVEKLAEIKVDNIHHSPFIYPASHLKKNNAFDLCKESFVN